MNSILKQPIEDNSVWTAETLQHDDTWLYQLTSQDILDLHQAMLTAKSKGKLTHQLTPDDFPLSSFLNCLNDYKNELEYGRGFLLLRGLPVENYTSKEIEILYYGIGLHLG